MAAAAVVASLALAASLAWRRDGTGAATTTTAPPGTATVSIPQGEPHPRRIVAVAPSAVELLFALGLGDRVVGVGNHVSWPPEASRLPRLGGLLDPRLETVTALRADLAVLLPSERELGERLAALGVDVLVVPHETLADVERAARAVADRAGVPAEGAAFATRWRRELAPQPLPERPRVVLMVARQPGELGRPLVAGPGSFLDELLDLLGATNAFADVGLAWPQVGLEEIVARDPDLIVELQPHAPTAAEADALRADWQRLPTLSAVRAGRIAVLGGDHALVPGPRLPQLYADLRRALVAALAPLPTGSSR